MQEWDTLQQKIGKKNKVIHEQNATNWCLAVASELKNVIKSRYQCYFGSFCSGEYVKSMRVLKEEMGII